MYPVGSPGASESVIGLPPDLADVVAAWQTLPAVIRAGILAMVKAAGAK